MINPLRTAEYNIMSTIRLLKLAKEFGIKRFMASTVYVNSEQGSFISLVKEQQKILSRNIEKNIN